MGIGTSVLLKINAEKVLKMLGVEATVEAADMATARGAAFDAQIVITTPELVESLEELNTKLSKALL